jgi:hypothetical protein
VTGTTSPLIWFGYNKFGWTIMRLMSPLLGGVALLCIPMFSAQAATHDRAASLDWQTFQVPECGTHAEYPAAIFAPVGEAEKGVGQRFERKDGRAVLSIYARENEDDDTPASYLRKNLRQPIAMLDYERVSRSFFAISMERDGTIFYSRCNFSARRSTIHCFDLVYPQSEKTAWDPVVTRISLSLRPLER